VPASAEACRTRDVAGPNWVCFAKESHRLASFGTAAQSPPRPLPSPGTGLCAATPRDFDPSVPHRGQFSSGNQWSRIGPLRRQVMLTGRVLIGVKPGKGLDVTLRPPAPARQARTSPPSPCTGRSFLWPCARPAHNVPASPSALLPPTTPSTHPVRKRELRGRLPFPREPERSLSISVDCTAAL
jgi:hypothetical protein